MAVSAEPKSDKAQAQELVKKAIAKSQASDHLAAIELYLDAYKLVPLAQLLSNIGTEYQAAGKPVEALKYFCKYLDAEPSGSLASYATAQAKVLHDQLGTKPVADKDVCKPAKPEPDPDDAATPKPAVKLAPVTGPGDDHKDAPSAGGSTIKWVGIGGIVAGAAVLGGGIYFGFRAKHYSDEITNHDPTKPWPDTIKQDEADGKSAQTKQIAFLIAGGAIAATGVVLTVVGRSSKPEEQHAGTTTTRVVPVVSPDSVGLVVSGGF